MQHHHSSADVPTDAASNLPQTLPEDLLEQAAAALSATMREAGESARSSAQHACELAADVLLHPDVEQTQRGAAHEILKEALPISERTTAHAAPCSSH